MASSGPRNRRANQPSSLANAPHAEVRQELTCAIFYKLLPVVLMGCGSQLLCAVLLAYFFRDPWLWKLSAVMLLISGTRISIVVAFPRRHDAELSPRSALRWEMAYGAFTLLYGAAMGAGSLYNFSHHGFSGAFICTLGTVCLCAGLSSRAGMRPWIVQAAGLLMLLPLALAAALSVGQPGIQAGAVLVLLFAGVHCHSVEGQFEILLEQLRSSRKLRQFAEQDPLTGLSNRRQFVHSLGTLCRASEPFAILYIDLDRFKTVNDTHGHAAGDTLLQQVADRLRGSVRQSDLLARLGGDEFAILQAPLASPASAVTLAQRINQTIGAPFEIAGQILSIGASVGIQLAAGNDSDPNLLLSTADEALYHVKQAGGGTFHTAGSIS